MLLNNQDEMTMGTLPTGSVPIVNEIIVQSVRFKNCIITYASLTFKTNFPFFSPVKSR